MEDEIEEKELFKIGEIASFFGVSVKALHIYEKKQIIKPLKVDAQTGYRYYSIDQVKQLNALIDLQQLGFSLDEIHEIMVGNMKGEELAMRLEKKKREWQERIAISQHKIENIDDILDRMKASREVSKLPEMTEEERAWMLVKMVCVEEEKTRSLLSEAIWL